MSTFIDTLLDPALPFLRNAFVAGLLSSVLFGVLGSVVTVRRMAGLAGAISHAVLGGIGIALYLSVNGIVPGLPPMVGALVFAVLSALIIALVSLKARQREDTVINALWAIGMSLGILFMHKTPGYADPMTWLFGNILMVSEVDLILLASMDILVIILAWRFHHWIEASSFDAEFARTRGVPVNGVFIAILALTAIAVVLLQTFVGIVMVIAMLTLPAGTAASGARNLSGMMIGATILSMVFTSGGLAISWEADLPGGAMVVVLSGAVFLLVSGWRMLSQWRLRRQSR